MSISLVPNEGHLDIDRHLNIDDLLRNKARFNY